MIDLVDVVDYVEHGSLLAINFFSPETSVAVLTSVYVAIKIIKSLRDWKK